MGANALTTGVDIISAGVKSGVVVDDVTIAAAIRLEVRSDNRPSWRRGRLSSDVEPLTEREEAKGVKTGASTVDVVLVASDITAPWSDW